MKHYLFSLPDPGARSGLDSSWYWERIICLWSSAPQRWLGRCRCPHLMTVLQGQPHSGQEITILSQFLLTVRHMPSKHTTLISTRTVYTEAQPHLSDSSQTQEKDVRAWGQPEHSSLGKLSSHWSSWTWSGKRKTWMHAIIQEDFRHCCTRLLKGIEEGGRGVLLKFKLDNSEAKKSTFGTKAKTVVLFINL